MNRTVSTPVRQPVPELQEHDVSVARELEAPIGGGNSVVHLRLLWESRKLLSRIAIYALLASTLIAFLIPVRYESTVRLMPPDNGQSGGLAMAAAALVGGSSDLGSSGGLGTMATQMLGLRSSSDIFVGILSSRTVQDTLVQQFDLEKLYHDGRMEDARNDLADHTSIAVDRKSQIITISVTDHDPKRAAAIGQSYIEQLNRLVAELSTSSARRERIFLEGRLRAVTKDLESAEKEFSQFSSKNTAIDIKEQGKAMVEGVAALQGDLIAAESELEGLRQIYSDSNVRVRSVRARIGELNRQLEKIDGTGGDASASAGQSVDSLYPSIRQLPLLGVSYADLYRRTRVQEAVFESLTREYESAKVQEVKEIPTVKVLDSPNVPDKKTFPPRLLIIFLGTAFAIASATTWLLGKTAWEQTDSADPRKALAQEVFSAFKANLPKFAHNGLEKHYDGREPVRRTPVHRDDDEGPE